MHLTAQNCCAYRRFVVHEGVIESLRRFKDDVKEVAQGFECGITLEKFSDLKEGDIFEVYDMEEIAVE